MKRSEAAVKDRVRAVWQAFAAGDACGLPTELPCPVSELLPAIAKDKKAQNGQIRLVLPVRIGKVVVKKVDPSTL